MSGYGHAQIVGISEDVEEAAEKETSALAAFGVDGRKLAGSIRAQREKVVVLNAEQEEYKRKLREKTKQYVAERRELYVMSSGGLDTILAAVSKDSDSAKNLRQLRSRVRRPRGTTALTVAVGAKQ